MKNAPQSRPSSVLLSIQPRHANKIFDGTKTVELRRRFPVLADVRTVIVYVSTPVRAIMGGFEISRIVTAPVSELWAEVKEDAGISEDEFDSYYRGTSIGYGIFIRKAWKTDVPISLEKLRANPHSLSPPQSYRYIHSHHLAAFHLVQVP